MADAMRLRNATWLHPIRGIVYFVSHPFLWPLFRSRLLPITLLSGFAYTLLFVFTYLPQVAFLAIFQGNGAWINGAVLVLGEGAAIVALLFEAFFVDETQVDVFDAVLLNEGLESLISRERVLHPDGDNPVKKLGKPTTSAVYAPFSLRQIVEFVILLPLNFVPVAGVPMFLVLTGYRAGPFHHWRYFQLMGFTKEDRKRFVRDRQLKYTAFGTVALVLQLIPFLSMFFLLTSAAGSALWAAEMEKWKQFLENQEGEDAAPEYQDNPCDEGGPPCKSCVALDIPCTYNRPSRRRGPPNRHAESLKKQKIEEDVSQSNLASSTAPKAAAATPPPVLLPTTANAVFAESICPLPTLQLLVDDYFTFIHPLVPVPHEPSFRAAFARREDVTNKRFLALLAAMIGSLVASFPRRPKLHLRTDAERQMYPNSITLVKKCHDVSVQARGVGYLDTSNTTEDAAISYHLSLCSAYVYNVRRCRMYLGECMTILRVYNLYAPCQQVPDPNPTPASPMSTGGPSDQFDEPHATTANLLAQELGRRLFFVCISGFKTLHQLGSTDGRIYVPPETPTDRYPPLPVEIDDEYLFATHMDPQPVGVVPQLTGFNANVRIFQCYNSLAALEIAFGTNEFLGWERQRQLIVESIQEAKKITAELPPELQLTPQVQTLSPSMNLGHNMGENDMEAANRRKIQYEIQKANIYITQLSTRSYLVDKYWTLFEGHKRLEFQQQPMTTSQMPSPDGLTAPPATAPDPRGGTTPDADMHAQMDYIGKMMREERGLVIKDLLCLLKSVQEIHIEPNGASFTNKVRQIASTLLSLPRGPDTTIANTPTNNTTTAGPQPLSTIDAENYLRTFLEILVRLEGVGVTNTINNAATTTTTTTNSTTTTDNIDTNNTPHINTLTNPLDPLSTAASSAAPPPIAPAPTIPTTTTMAASSAAAAAAAAAFPSPDSNFRAMSYGSGSSEEEEGMKQWASFKEFQQKFMEEGGHLYSI
ncbi:Polyprotein pp220 [Talaromyces islandicus]|uniref:Polyprotein pp220 n=1 Tax=Talaromyces islandicus TaxID=28573 RepID=A0A0U1LPS4_TALIS|nr:Polyprotein pp220 [Talaromyces islandicus]